MKPGRHGPDNPDWCVFLKSMRPKFLVSPVHPPLSSTTKGLLKRSVTNERTIIDDARVPDSIVLQTGVVRLRESRVSAVG
jgi:hypothetical protein